MSNENLAKEIVEGKKSSSKWKIILIVIVLLAAAVAGFGYYRISTTKSYPAGTKIDGVDVSGKTVDEAILAINESCNETQLVDGGNVVAVVPTKFVYDVKSDLKKQLKIASVDPRLLIGQKVGYTIPLKTAEGLDETVEQMKVVLPDAEGTVYTADAHVDLETMEIVPEVQGNNIDYAKLAHDIADQREADPTNGTYKYAAAKYIDKPDVKAADLNDELEFDKQYLAPGMDLKTPEGLSYHVSPAILSNIVKYSKNGPKYDKDGATVAAQAVAEDYKQSTMTLKTLAGDKEMRNFVLGNSVDIEKTADAMYKAAKGEAEGELFTTEVSGDAIATHIEVNLSAQTVYVVKDGQSIFSTPVVTGGPGHRTPTGIYKIAYKTMHTTLKGKNDDGSDYESPVNYWMPFNGGIGFHDANWRGAFGGSIYVSGGSHGCVNMPPSVTGRFYNLISSGMIVYVYA